MSNFPSWLHHKIPKKRGIIKKKINSNNLNTVCSSAKCPNRLICFEKKCSAFLTLGTQCTRKCSFCNIDHCKKPPPPDPKEPYKIALFIKKQKLKHAVITMVTRDDLVDQGAFHIKKIVEEIKKLTPNTKIEVLTSDFSGRLDLLDIVCKSNIYIFNHNIETTKALTPQIRDKASYNKSLNILHYVKTNYPHLLVKSGLMVGFGETKEEVKNSISDLKKAGCDIITIGQYLQPSKKNIKVKEFIHPLVFKEYKQYAKSIGVLKILASPFIRSSSNF